jgi:DNA-binding IclR family transcriptional regulator
MFGRIYMDSRTTQSVPSVERALKILDAVSNSRNGLSLSDIVRKLALPRSSTHTLLLTLERHGYLHGDRATGRYTLGSEIFHVAHLALGAMELREQAAPFLTALMMRTRLTVHFGLLEQNGAVLIEKVEPPGLVRLATWVGRRMEVHCTGVGKALIAYMTEEQIDRLIKDHGLPRHNENTISSARKLKEQLSIIRKQGYAVDDEEDEIGLRCVGSAVFNSMNVPVAAASIAGTIGQINAENLALLASQVKQTAQSISRRLGFCPPSKVSVPQ